MDGCNILVDISFQDPHEREFINCDQLLGQIFQTKRMKFAEIPQRLNPLLHPPDPIVRCLSKSSTSLQTVVHIRTKYVSAHCSEPC